MSIGNTILKQIMSQDFWFLGAMGNTGHKDRFLIENGLKLIFRQGKGKPQVHIQIILTPADTYKITSSKNKEVFEDIYCDQLVEVLESILKS